MKRLLERDPDTGVETWFYKDAATGSVTVEEIQDVEPSLERNKSIQNLDSGGAMGLSWFSRQGIKNNLWHVASIPNIVIAMWHREGINVFNRNDWPAVRRKLNDPQWKYLRTGLGRV